MNQSSFSRWVPSPQMLLSTGSATIGPLPQQRWSLATSSTIVRRGPQVGHTPSAGLIYIQNSQDRDRVHRHFRHCLAAQCRPTRRTRNAPPHLYSARGSQANLPDNMKVDSARLDQFLGQRSDSTRAITSAQAAVVLGVPGDEASRFCFMKLLEDIPKGHLTSYSLKSKRELRPVLLRLNRRPRSSKSGVIVKPGHDRAHQSCLSVQPHVRKRNVNSTVPAAGNVGGPHIEGGSPGFGPSDATGTAAPTAKQRGHSSSISLSTELAKHIRQEPEENGRDSKHPT